MRDAVCLGCEHRVRRDGGALPIWRHRRPCQCTPEAWCPHDRRCLACDGWSCVPCRFHQGDGSDVVGIVESVQPSCLFVDFDRTLCSTRGGSPLKGSHSVDDDLLALCAQMDGRVHIVTRNAHVDDIRLFLAERGLPSVPIHRVSKAISKASVVCDPRWTEDEVDDRSVMTVDADASAAAVGSSQQEKEEGSDESTVRPVELSDRAVVPTRPPVTARIGPCSLWTIRLPRASEP